MAPVDRPMDPRDRERLRLFLDRARGDIVAALALALGVTPERVLIRLRVQAVADLAIEPISPPVPRRPRGRPRRTVDRAIVVQALRATDGAIRAAAKRARIPRMTFARYVAREKIPESAYVYGPGISEEHGKLLAASAITPAVASARGYRSVGVGEKMPPGFRRIADRAGLLIPIWNVHGRGAWYLFRPDVPERRNRRYLLPRDATRVLDVSPLARQRVLDASEPLWLTEGARKADAATSAGLACAAFMGVRLLLPASDGTWDYIGIAGREVIVAFDADAAWNTDVANYERALVQILAAKGARVSIVRLPGSRYNKVGLDDYLAKHGRDALLGLPRQPCVVSQP